MNNIKLSVKEAIDIIEYLVKYTDYNKKKIKSLIKYNNVHINGKNNFKLPFILKCEDIIEIKVNFNKIEGLEIIYEDKELIVVNKEAGLLTVGNDSEAYDTLYYKLRGYARENNFKIFIVHRLDKDTSGVVLLAKSEKLKKVLQDNWEKLAFKREYIAIVGGEVPANGRIDNLLYEEDNTFVHSSKMGKRAITNYEVLKANSNYSLLKIEIETGRKNQIRVHMAEMGHPVIGDHKYGSKINPIKRLGLHAKELGITHPFTNESLNFKADIPQLFKKIFK